MENYLAVIRKKQGLTQEQLAGLLETTRAHISNIERGKHNIEPWLDKLSETFNIPYEEFIFEPWQDVQITGYTNAAGEIEFLPKNQWTQTVRVPKILGTNLTAIAVRGNSLWPRYFEGEALIYRKLNKITPNLLGKECVVQITNGALLVKILESGNTASSYNLSSWNGPTQKQVYLDWIGEVLGRF